MVELEGIDIQLRRVTLAISTRNGHFPRMNLLSSRNSA